MYDFCSSSSSTFQSTKAIRSSELSDSIVLFVVSLFISFSQWIWKRVILNAFTHTVNYTVMSVLLNTFSVWAVRQANGLQTCVHNHKFHPVLVKIPQSHSLFVLFGPQTTTTKLNCSLYFWRSIFFVFAVRVLISCLFVHLYW